MVMSPSSRFATAAGAGDELPPFGTPTTCMPVSELQEPHVPSERRACYRCGVECWISLSAVPLCDLLGGRVQCLRHFEEDVAAGAR